MKTEQIYIYNQRKKLTVREFLALFFYLCLVVLAAVFHAHGSAVEQILS